MPWALSFLLIWLNKLSNPFSYSGTKPINWLPHKYKRNNDSHKTSSDDISRSMYTRSHSRKRSYQWEYQQDSSKSEEFFVVVFYPSQQWNHRNTHTDSSMIRRKTRTWQKLMKHGFFFEISQSKNHVWPRFIYEKLNSYIYQDTKSDSRSNIHRRHFMIQSTFKRFNVWAFERLNDSVSVQ